ncbi:helix-turn-helix transcriptional regulator [Nocardioides lijunqiniae]|uniref:helix-turn-helix transcriptional regulator n=1 Tax=Nocardioides lijunqiniae TaxID=2760832 RepID=UPI00187860EF|nr:response regulator transcription factor [Nocardioides lijunqiniae]
MSPEAARPTALRITLTHDYPVVDAGLRAMLSGYEHRIQMLDSGAQTDPDADVDIVLYGTTPDAGDGIPLPTLPRGAGARVVLFAWALPPEAVLTALAQGAAGCLSKTLSSSELVDCLERIVNGERVVSAATLVQGRASMPSPDDGPSDDHQLSPREAQVLSLIARGMSTREIAATMFLSVNTIKTYIRTTYAKTGVTSRSQAVIWATSNNTFTLDTGDAEDSSTIASLVG